MKTADKALLFIKYRFEALVWIAGLLLMATMSPENGHASLCPLKATGIGFCPGCGLGHSIAWLFRGDFAASLHAHPLGLVAVIILSVRIFTIFRKPIIAYKP